VTAAFNKNVLTVVDRELGADFDADAFDHVALWDADNEWIEMRLRSRTDQTVKIPALDLAVDFTAGEELRTEISAKFRKEGVRRTGGHRAGVGPLVDRPGGTLRAVTERGALTSGDGPSRALPRLGARWSDA
jgi:hypothetical protein